MQRHSTPWAVRYDDPEGVFFEEVMVLARPLLAAGVARIERDGRLSDRVRRALQDVAEDLCDDRLQRLLADGDFQNASHAMQLLLHCTPRRGVPTEDGSEVCKNGHT